MISYEEDIFDKAFNRHVRGVEDHHFHHYNGSMGIQIYSKAHYKHEMKMRGMVPYDVAEQSAQDWDNKNKPKEFDSLSPKAESIIRSIKQTADKYGNIKLGGRAIKALEEMGAIQSRNPHIPEGGL